MSCILMLLMIAVNPCPSNNLLWRSPATVGYFYPRHTSSFSAHCNKIPTAIPIFSGPGFPTVPLPVSRDIDFHQKSKMAAAELKCTYFTVVWLTEDIFEIPTGRLWVTTTEMCESWNFHHMTKMTSRLRRKLLQCTTWYCTMTYFCMTRWATENVGLELNGPIRPFDDSAVHNSPILLINCVH